MQEGEEGEEGEEGVEGMMGVVTGGNHGPSGGRRGSAGRWGIVSVGETDAPFVRRARARSSISTWAGCCWLLLAAAGYCWLLGPGGSSRVPRGLV